MIKIKNNRINIKSSEDGSYNPMPSTTCDSTYEIAKRHGFTGTEEEWNNSSGGTTEHTARAGVSDVAGSLSLKQAIGSSINPTYINAEGNPSIMNYTLTSAHSMEASDTADTKTRTLMTNVAMQAEIKKITNIVDDLYAKITVPYDVSNLTYNGEEQSPVWEGYDESMCVIGGVTSATNAGTYITTFTPIAPYIWKDGKEGTREIKWQIKRASVIEPTPNGELYYTGD